MSYSAEYGVLDAFLALLNCAGKALPSHWIQYRSKIAEWNLAPQWAAKNTPFSSDLLDPITI